MAGWARFNGGDSGAALPWLCAACQISQDADAALAPADVPLK